MALLDVWIYRYYAYFPLGQKLSYLGLAAVAGAVIAGGASWYLVRALAATGVLAPFASGREQVSQRMTGVDGWCDDRRACGRAADRPPRIDARDWGWRHAGRRAWAVSELSLRIEPGERVLLLGASGSGKSTLLAGLAGLLHGQQSGEARGTLTVDGREPHEARHRSGLVLQDPETQLVMSRAGDDVAFGPENYGVPAGADLAPRLGVVGHGGLPLRPLDRPTAELSGGEKQRLALAGILANEPGLLLLDEPTANLDPGRRRARPLRRRPVLERTGATMVLVEHRVGAVAAADRPGGRPGRGRRPDR